MTLAVTGHRDLVIDDRLIKEIDIFFVQMLEKYGSITLLSALADGADQIVAKCALKYKNISVDVPLPFGQEEYLQTLEHKENFFSLLKDSTHHFVIPKVYEHPYENLGHYLVDNSDVLLALWEGSFTGKQGGTGEVVSYAKSKNHRLMHIYVTRKNN